MSILFSDIDATCASLGYHDGNKYFIENDTLQSLKHLIWILRRDNLDSHECRRYIGHKKVLQTDLIPMLAHYCNHGELSDVLLRLIVNLTSPAILFFRQDLPKTNTGRQIYLDLVEISYEFKVAFASNEIWAALVARFKKIIDIDIAIRTEEQSVIVERILVLARNVLQVPANPQTEKRVDNDLSIHDQILRALHESGMFELILYILCSHYENQYYLHALELIYLIFRDQNAETLATSAQERSATEKHIDEQALIAARRNEMAKSMRNLPPARHSRFGGTYVYRNMKSVSDKDLICHQPLEKVVSNDLSRDKKKAKANFRLIKDEDRYERQSALCVRNVLHEFCNDILTSSAFNNLIGQGKRLVERNHASDTAIGYDQSYLLWAIRFFLQFNRFKGFNMEHVTKAISKETIHWITLQIQHDAEMIQSDKKKKLIWNRRLQLGALAYAEFLQSLQAMESVESEAVKMLSSEFQHKIFSTSEYSEIILHLILSFNENSITRICLRNLLQAANIFLNMMEKFDSHGCVAPPKKEKNSDSMSVNESPKASTKNTQKMERLQAEWTDKILPKITEILASDEKDVDNTMLVLNPDEPIEDQKNAQIKNIIDLLNDEDYEKALQLLDACRNTWVCDEFGTEENYPIDKLTVLEEIFLASNNDEDGGDDGDFWDDFDKSETQEENGEDDREEEQETVQSIKPFADVEKRLVNQKVVRACAFVLQSWESSTYREIKSAVTILHRIAVNQKFPIMLMQAQLFRIFQQVFDAPFDARYEELRRIGVFIVRQFTKLAPKNPKMYAEILFFKSHRECYDIENNYEEHHKENEGSNKAWLEHEEEELQKLFMLNQETPQTDEDVIDWIVDNLSEKTRTRRGVIKKLKELGLIFKAPTKKSNAASVNRNLFIRDEDDKLYELYNEYRLDDNCLDRIMEVFRKKRTPAAVVKRMVQLGLIADESELMAINKPIKKNKKKVSELREFPQSEDDAEEEEKEEIDSENDSEEEEISVRKIKWSMNKKKKKFGHREEENESKLLSPTMKDKHDDDDDDNDNEEEVEIAETVSKKRQLLHSDSEDDNVNTSAHSYQKKKVRRIIDDSDDE